jgi:hypothetical protein
MNMATRSEQFHADAQRHPSKKSRKRAAEHAVKKARVKRKTKAHENVRAGKKATVALQPGSRKSTRKSANRSKFDAAIEVRGERAQGTPEARFRNQK